MTYFAFEKVTALVVSTAAILSFGSVVDVRAETVFPPAHIAPAAEFAPATRADGDTQIVPWYRAGSDTGRAFGALSGHSVVLAGAPGNPATPWYRSTN